MWDAIINLKCIMLWPAQTCHFKSASRSPKMHLKHDVGNARMEERYAYYYERTVKRFVWVMSTSDVPVVPSPTSLLIQHLCFCCWCCCCWDAAAMLCYCGLEVQSGIRRKLSYKPILVNIACQVGAESFIMKKKKKNVSWCTPSKHGKITCWVDADPVSM